MSKQQNKTELLDDALEFCFPQLICSWNPSQFPSMLAVPYLGSSLFKKKKKNYIKG